MTAEEIHSFATVIAKYRPTLFKVAATFEADPKLQQDLHQEILLAIWQSLAKFKGESSIHTFIYRVAYNQALNHIAKHSRSPQYQDLDEAHQCQQPGPEQQAKTSQGIDQLMLSIRRLPVLKRQMITLALEGVSYSDIAYITGLSINNVGVQLNHAKKELRNMMEYGNE
jgi:RNA polymerase sigma-70 factor (ECF subfamily)